MLGEGAVEVDQVLAVATYLLNRVEDWARVGVYDDQVHPRVVNLNDIERPRDIRKSAASRC